MMEEKDTKFKKGNEFWKLARSPGRKTKYSPETLLKKAKDYFEYCDNTPWIKNDILRSGKRMGEVVGIPTGRPYTEIGFYAFAGIDRGMFKNYERKAEFTPICQYIQGVIRTNQLEGALVGAYNANIVARMQGLADKKTLEVARFLETMENEDLVSLAEEIVNMTDDE